MSLKKLSWEITPREGKKRKLSNLSLTLILFLFLEIGLFFSGDIHPDDTKIYLFFILGTIGLFVFLLIINYFKKYPKRSYQLSSRGICLRLNNFKKCYNWDDFDYFYETPGVKEGRQTKKVKGLKEIEQQTTRPFYLKLKPKNIFQRILKGTVVVYGEPNNLIPLTDFLSAHLTKKEKLWVGFVRYYFK